MDLQAKKASLGELLGQKRVQLQVPPYQRAYAWTNEQIDDLWDDIIAALGSRHFIGSIVLAIENSQNPQIIDGQQRLTTLTILLGLLRDRYWNLGNENAALGIQEDLLFASRREEDDAQYALLLGRSNWRVFRDLVLRPPNDPLRLNLAEEQLSHEERYRNARLLDNYTRLSDRLDNWLEGFPLDMRAKRLADLERVIVDGLELVEIRMSDLSDAFLLFETLNDRGLQLSAADLLKNHLLGQVAGIAKDRDDVERMSTRWDEMLDILGRRVDLTRFFRHYLLVRHHPVAKEEVYDRFKKEVAELGPEALMTELAKAAQSYGDFEDPNRIASKEPQVAAVLHDLQTLRAVRCYVMLLPARRWLSPGDFVTVARRAEVLTYRYSSICGLDAKALELVYHKAAKVLDTKRQDGLAEAIELLDGAMPDSDEFVAAFMRQKMGVQYLLRYTLARIEDHLAPGLERPVQLERSHIEHIMPKTLDDNWVRVLGDGGARHQDYVHRWGNLTLLHSRQSQTASNRTLDGKRSSYRSSEIRLTQLLSKESEWGYEQIDRRQEWLAHLADEIWTPHGPTVALRPDIAGGASRQATNLPPDVRQLFESLHREITVEELIDLLPGLDVHISDIEIAAATNPDIDVARALDLHRCLTALVEDAIDMGAEERTLVAAAVEYFTLREDDSDDLSEQGLRDDALVANTVCRLLGRGDLQVSADRDGD